MNGLKKLVAITILGLSLIVGGMGVANAQPEDTMEVVISVEEVIHFEIVEPSLSFTHIIGSTGWIKIGDFQMLLQDTGQGWGPSLKMTAYSALSDQQWIDLATGGGVKVAEKADSPDWVDEAVLTSVVQASANEGVELLEATFITPINMQKRLYLFYDADLLADILGATPTAGSFSGGIHAFYSHSQ